MENRKKYSQQLSELFKPFEGDLKSQMEIISCDNRNSSNEFAAMSHQKIVAEYLNLYSPYRGLLLYHGLGSGKTCTSITIAEGMKTDKHVFIMTPASLNKNFMNEMKICGDALYKKNQFWEFISTVDNGAWLVNINEPSNFAELSTQQKQSVDSQIDEMIRIKYTSLNYNGLNEKKMQEITQNNTINPFDNSVIVIDEAHNFVSRIVNKLKSRDSISYRLYHNLMNATNARIVFLSGTPIINSPSELGVLFNILRGYITTWSIPIKLTGASKLNTDKVLQLLDNANVRTFDYVNVSGNMLTITRNPYGFVNTQKKGVIKGTTRKRKPDITNNTLKLSMNGGKSKVLDNYNGVTLDELGNISNEDFLSGVLNVLTEKSNNLNIDKHKITVNNYTALPDDPNEFMKLFIAGDKQIVLSDKDAHYFKNVELFQRRILGLTSYFRSALEQLLPRIELTENQENYHIEYIEMSKLQFDSYVEIRKAELDKESQSRKMKHHNPDDVYKITSSYRIFSRAACNFVFPMHIKRPKMNNINFGNANNNEETEAEMDLSIDNELDNDGVNKSIKPINEVDNEPEIDTNIQYSDRVNMTIDKLTNSPSIENPSQNINYLLKDNLRKYCSPKFARIIDNVTNPEHDGLHLIYSAFRTLEGIGILRRVLIENGFVEFKLIYTNNEWTLPDETEDEIGKPRFVLHTGTESVDEKELILNIYNGKWDYVPSSISSILKSRAESNLMGDIIKVIMITASGAEGINLLNTRYVHLIEPYWHMVRLDQVIGRARRICSHSALPPEMQTVKVFLYISNFNTYSKSNIEILNKDVSKIDGNRQIATDESLYESALMKQHINNEFLDSIKQTAVDCSFYKSNGLTDTHKCYNLGEISSNDFSSYPNIEVDKRLKSDLNVQLVEMSGIKFKYTDNKYYILNDSKNQNEAKREVYDVENYKNASLNTEPLKVIGHLITDKNQKQTIKFIDTK